MFWLRTGHYANAIEDAAKALNALVRLKSGVNDRDGSTLMEFVFNPKNPVLKFNILTDDFTPPQVAPLFYF